MKSRRVTAASAYYRRSTVKFPLYPNTFGHRNYVNRLGENTSVSGKKIFSHDFRFLCSETGSPLVLLMIGRCEVTESDFEK